MHAAAFGAFMVGILTAQTPRQDNLDFHSGTLAGWRGQGFYVTTADPRGPSVALGVCSSDRGVPGRQAALRYTFVVPAEAGRLCCRAFAVCARGFEPDHRLDVLLLTEQSEVVPKKVRGANGWEPAETLLPREGGQAREYAWELQGLGGHRVQILLKDEDDRPGCYLFCSGFRLEGGSNNPERDFAEHMRRLEKERDLPPLARFESRHFVAWSNADPAFTKSQLRDCEMIYQLFFEHFRRRGFSPQAPSGKLMVAVFDSQVGFEAYLGQPMPSSVTGVYNIATNHLVVYDLSQNKGLVASRNKAIKDSLGFRGDRDRLRYLETIHRAMSEWSKDGSLSTAMHETAHQLAFNSGLQNRYGDIPVWLCEGLACYCEATDQGGWQGIGEPNPARIATLAATLKRKGKVIPLRTLVVEDDWRQKTDSALLGYSQSWALFRLLMQQRPSALRRYLALVFPRRTPDHRLTDFAECFGSDFEGLEQHYLEYVQALVHRHTPRQVR
jgi:hypothetical protein